MKRDGAFTLIELLVVVAVIAVLIAILIPSLGAARATARATKCGAGMRAIGQAVAGYQAESSNVFPPSYVYPDALGSWNTSNQIHPPAYGYQHWSYFLFGNLKDLKAFTCPEFEYGGVPRTNPGPNAGYWCSGQVDQTGASGLNNTLEDRQAPFVAFAANSALMPRNKFNDAAVQSDPSTAGGSRTNIFVNRVRVTSESTTILATEFNSHWETIAQNQGAAYKAVGHRPIMPFGLLGSNNEYAVSPTGFFTSINPASLMDSKTLQGNADSSYCLIQDNIQLNAVGRNHPGSASAGGKSLGGSSNFLYVDGHVDRKSIVDTLTAKEWGSNYFSINGDNSVR